MDKKILSAKDTARGREVVYANGDRNTYAPAPTPAPATEPAPAAPPTIQIGARVWNGASARARSAQELREATFGQKAQMDFAKLKLDEQRMLIDKAVAVEKFKADQHKRETEARRALAAAAAIERVGALDHTDEAFEAKMAKVLSEHPDGLDSKSLLTVVAGRRKQAEAFTKAKHARAAASFTEPMARATYDEVLAKHKDPNLANMLATSVADQVTRAKGIYGDLTPEERGKLYTNGSFAFDQLTPLEMAVAERKAQKAATTTALDQGLKAARIDSAGGDSAKVLAAVAAPAPAATPATDPARKLLLRYGRAAAAAPATPTPAPTPAAAPATPTPAPTPTAAPVTPTPAPTPAAAPVTVAAAPEEGDEEDDEGI